MISKVKYDSFIQSVINALKLLNIYIYPYYIYLEQPPESEASDTKMIKDNLQLRLANKDDIEEMLSFPDRLDDRDKFIKRLDRGDHCILARYTGKIVGFSWATTSFYEFLHFKYELDDNEAYLYDAYTASAYRGLKIAYHLRNRLYKELEKNGKFKFYSVTIKSNKAAVRFKRNIQAKVIENGFHLNLFNKWHYHKQLAFENNRKRIT
jgi:ribosomal protein S18 acetylase RimI-like enzyme